MKRNTVAKLLVFFISWRLLLFTFLGLSVYLSLQKNFLGGGLGNYIKAPYFWAWGNFDGEHYISIAQRGYGQGEQAFFPLYSLLIKGLSVLFGKGIEIYVLMGLLISNFSFFISYN